MQTFQLNLPPFLFQVETNIQLVAQNAKNIYGDAYSDEIQESVYVDCYLSATYSGGIRRFYKPQARFLCDEREPFKPLKRIRHSQCLNGGMNWTVAAHELQYAIVHSAVLAKDDKAILFPAPPGSGKSTLTAHLAQKRMAFIIG